MSDLNENLLNNHIQEIISEIEQCREDERSGNSQVLSVLATAGTILGVLVGASYLSRPELKNQPLYHGASRSMMISYIIKIATNTRIFFWLTCLLFDAAFLYVITLGIKSILRYYHMQDLQDRLHELLRDMPDNDGRGCFLRFNEFSAPVVTMNFKHLSSSHSALHFFAYGLASLCAVLFSIGVVFSQYGMIDKTLAIDKVVFYSTLLLMGVTFYLFIRLTANAQKVAEFAWNTAHDNQAIREEMIDEHKKNRAKEIKDRRYKKSRLFLHRFTYAILPKRSDWYKSLLIIIGYVWCLYATGQIQPGMSLRDNIAILFANSWTLIICFFTFEILAYQARYQVNDIIGIEEDREMGKDNKLIPNWLYEIERSENSKNIIQTVQISAKVLISRCILAALLSVFIVFNQHVLMPIYLAVLVIITWAYETVRKKGSVSGVFFFVGLGYPLRVMVGASAAKPGFFMSISKGHILTLLMIVIWGVLGATLAWASEVVNRMDDSMKNSQQLPRDYIKQHYNYFQRILKDRYLQLRSKDASKAKTALRSQGNLSDPWNAVLLLSLVISVAGQCLWIRNETVFVLCLMANVLLFVAIVSHGYLFLTVNVISVLMYAAALVIGLRANSIGIDAASFVIVEGAISATYMLLRYQPQFKPFNLKGFIAVVFIKIFGEDTCKRYFSM